MREERRGERSQQGRDDRRVGANKQEARPTCSAKVVRPSQLEARTRMTQIVHHEARRPGRYGSKASGPRMLAPTLLVWSCSPLPRPSRARLMSFLATKPVCPLTCAPRVVDLSHTSQGLSLPDLPFATWTMRATLDYSAAKTVVSQAGKPEQALAQASGANAKTLLRHAAEQKGNWYVRGCGYWHRAKNEVLRKREATAGEGGECSRRLRLKNISSTNKNKQGAQTQRTTE